MANPELIRPLSEAKDFQTAIQIISREQTQEGMQFLIDRFTLKFPDLSRVLVIPIMRGGSVVGEALAQTTGARLTPMRMTYYNDKLQRLPAPKCITPPDIHELIGNGDPMDIVFAEAIVESQGTILASEELIRRMIQQTSQVLPAPTFHTFALISKTGGRQVSIPDLNAAFEVNPDIWVFGMGCDLNEQGRECREIGGILSPYAEATPQQPYYTSLFETLK